MENNPSSRRSRIIRIILVVLLAAVTVSGLFFLPHVQKSMSATHTYNEAVQQYNLQADAYNEAVRNSSIDNINGLPSSLKPLFEESEGFFDNLKVVLGANSADKILSDADTVSELTARLQAALQIIRQITVPSEEWVMERLHQISEITGTQAVTKDLDPDEQLGKEGSYQSCVYFTVSDIESKKVEGNSIIEKGTDAGGCIEIYATLADAEARCTYLAGFDHTVLYSGSYAIVGTMVIRTSYLLDNQQQFALTDAITSVFTALED